MEDNYLETSIYLSVIYRKNNTVRLRKVGDEYILVPISGETAKQGSVYSLNRVGAHVWELINGERNIKQILDELAQAYKDAQLETMEIDIQYFLSDLEKTGVIDRTE